MMYQGGWFEDPKNIFGDNAAPGDVRIVDCPFSNGGASGAGSGDCLGSSPSYYETMQAADVDGDGLDELVARASDGLRVKKYDSVTGLLGALPTLTDLAGGAANVAPALWGTIRTGDIDGNTREEVLALTGSGVQAWSYDPASKSWQRLQPSTPLALTGDWLTKPEYYSTIQTGDVDGDGRADVLARGPFGIRTWFYDRRGTGGWERYMADGYPDFPGYGDDGGRTGGVCRAQRARAARRARSPRAARSATRGRWRRCPPASRRRWRPCRSTSRVRWWATAPIRRSSRRRRTRRAPCPPLRTGPGTRSRRKSGRRWSTS